MKKIAFVIILATLALSVAACEFSFSTANISDAYMAADPDGAQRTTSYAPDATLYAIVELANAPDDTVVKASWYAVSVEGVEPNFLIDEATITGGDARLTFDLQNEAGFIWPTGSYRVDLYLNDELNTSLEFQVQ